MLNLNKFWSIYFFYQAKDNNQSVCIVGEKPILKQYKKYAAGALAESLSAKDQLEVGQLMKVEEEVKASQKTENDDEVKTSQKSENGDEKVRGVVYAKTSSSKDSIEKACELTFSHNLTICHVNLERLVNEPEDGKTEEEDEAR